MCGIGAILETHPQHEGQTRNILKEHLQMYEAFPFKPGSLCARGPDFCSKVDFLNGRLLLLGTVLHLRGLELCPQPLVDPKTGNALLWNGEVFGGFPQVGHDENDTVKVLQLLCTPSFQSGADIANALSAVKGPYSFIFYHQKQGRIFFGKDPFGRRSLLLHIDPEAQTVAVMSVAPEIKPAKDSAASLQNKNCSVGENKNSVVELQTGETETREWTELPVSGIFSIECMTEKIQVEHHAWPEGTLGLALFGLQADDEENKEEEKEDEVSSLKIVENKKDKKQVEGPGPKVNEQVFCNLEPQKALAVPHENILQEHPQEITALQQENISTFLQLMRQSVCRRVSTIPDPVRLGHSDASCLHEVQSRVGVLFSGGIDSVFLAALCHECVPEIEAIDLINVCFEGGAQHSPDRLASIVALKELQDLYPLRCWRLVCVDVTYDEVLSKQHCITQLMKPCTTVMDFNIAAAFWFASRAEGNLYNESSSLFDTHQKNIEGQSLLRFGSEQSPHKKRSRTGPADGCSVTSCRRKHKAECAFKVCRNCCLKVQSQINPITFCLKDRHPSLTLWLEENASWLKPLLKESASRGTAMCKAHRIKPIQKSTEQDPDEGTQVDIRQSYDNEKPTELETTIFTSNNLFKSKVKVLLVGIGADEQLGGYGRHRSVFLKAGAEALQKELSKDMNRLWSRNLGRDDRCISDHGREARFPFLDEDVVSFIHSLQVQEVADLTLPLGIGDKKILRDAAKSIGLTSSCNLVKRAIQFGSRIAKHSNIQSFGSNRKGKGDLQFQTS